MNQRVKEVHDPGVSGQLTGVKAEDGSAMYIRDMDVKEALVLGQAALDAKDARIMTVTRGGKRFPTYWSNPAIERPAVVLNSRLRAEIDVVLKHGKTADVAPSSSGPIVTKPIRQKHRVLYGIARVWVPMRDNLVRLFENLAKWLRHR